MVEYAKMKNADLEALLKERGLPTGGKKADMVDRLTKDDEKKTDAPSKLHPEDEIDWDDEGDEGATDTAKVDLAAPAAKESEAAAPAPSTAPGVSTTAKPAGEGQASNPQAVPNQKVDIDPAKTDDLSVKPPSEEKEGPPEAAEEKKAPAVDYTKGLAATNMEEEIEKRRRRAEKFGLKIDDDDENMKKLERAKKFGEVGPPKGLDDALPERQERRKRGRDDNDDSGRNKRRGGGRFGGRGGRGGDRRRDDRNHRGSRDDRRESNWMNETERKKAEERKAKWAKPAAAS
jgi:SAP domain-containing ribonucleoprotein